MYIILIKDDHSFVHTNRKRIMKRSNMIDTVQFLVDPIYGDGTTYLDMKKVNVVLEYVTPISRTYRTVVLHPEEELYKNKVQYLLPLDLKFTSEAGNLEFTINFSYLSMNDNGDFVEQVRPIGYTYLEITDTKNWSDYIPSADLDNIAQMMMSNQAMVEQNRINIELANNMMPTSLKKDSESIYLINELGEKVGDSIPVDSLGDCGCDDGVPVIDFSVKTKLDGIATGATKITVDSSLSSTSTNPVQNKVINSALSGKVPTTRTVNGKALSANITLSASDVGADASGSATSALNSAKSYSDTNLATAKSYTDTKVADLVGSAPETMDTLAEVAAAIEAHQDVTDALNSAIGNKVDKVSGKGLSTNDYTTTEKNKLAGIATGAEVNQNAFSNVVVGSTTISADSKTDSLTITAGTNVTITPDADNDKITITAKDTTYSAGTGISLSGTTINHSNSVTAGTASGDASKTLSFGGTFTIPQVTYDAQGHITSKGTTTMTMPATPKTVSGNAGSATKLATARAIDGVNFNGQSAINHYGTCDTAAATTAKVVSLTGFTLATGSRVMVKFTVTNTASSPTLNVNSTGAKAIYYRGAAISAGYLAANRVYEFVYDGTNYELVGDLDTNTTYGSAGSSLGLVKSGGDVTISSGVITVNDDSHNHVISNVDGLQAALDGKAASSHGTHVTYSTTAPAANGTAAVGTATTVSRSDHVHPLQTSVSGSSGSCTGNSATATKLATARTIALSGGCIGTATSFNGSANISIPVTSVDAAKLTLASSDTLILDGSL